MKIEHQKDLGFGLITPARRKDANIVYDVTFGKYYAKLNSFGTFYDDSMEERPFTWYEHGNMVDVEIKQATPTHNIKAGDWTCWQNDQELYAKLEQAFINAGFKRSATHPDIISEEYPLMGGWEFGGINYFAATPQVDEDLRAYRTPEYLLSAFNAQPKVKTYKELEIESIIDYLSLDKKDDWSYAETLYKGGFRVIHVVNTERYERE